MIKLINESRTLSIATDLDRVSKQYYDTPREGMVYETEVGDIHLFEDNPEKAYFVPSRELYVEDLDKVSEVIKLIKVLSNLSVDDLQEVIWGLEH